MDSSLDIDQVVLANFSKGDEQAFRQVFDVLFRPLCFFAARFTGQKEEAEDMVSQAFHKLWVRREGFASWPVIRSFLYTTVRNQCLDLLKHREVVSHVHKQLLAFPEEVDTFSESRMMQAELLNVIFTEIGKLPERYRVVLELSFKEELSIREIALRINKEENHVRADKSRALALLRSSLRDKNLYGVALWLWSLYEAGHFHR